MDLGDVLNVLALLANFVLVIYITLSTMGTFQFNFQVLLISWGILIFATIAHITQAITKRY